ncbi:unnamed protein product [Schistosoma turkestanicum]|nr:unnamed protein product [Schistosoma turkestanicum]
MVDCKVEGQPPAKYMSPLNWNYELAEQAQQLANKCVLRHELAKSKNFNWVGQNIALHPTIESGNWNNEKPYEVKSRDLCPGAQSTDTASSSSPTISSENEKTISNSPEQQTDSVDKNTDSAIQNTDNAIRHSPTINSENEKTISNTPEEQTESTDENADSAVQNTDNAIRHSPTIGSEDETTISNTPEEQTESTDENTDSSAVGKEICYPVLKNNLLKENISTINTDCDYISP